MVDTRMDELVWLRNQLKVEGNDLLREMVRSFAQDLMSAEADVVCGAPWGQQSPDRVNRRNGYRTRRWDTRVGNTQTHRVFRLGPVLCGSADSRGE